MVLLTAAVAGAACAQQQAPARPLPTLLLHLSDTHFSTNIDKYWTLFGDREGDMGLFAAEVVPALAPSAVLVTGAWPGQGGSKLSCVLLVLSVVLNLR